MTKPIDWTKPLQVVDTKEPVKEVRINFGHPGDVMVILSPGRSWLVAADGRSMMAGGTVENIPPESRIVERWAVVSADTFTIEVGPFVSRDSAMVYCKDEDRRFIAKMLIEVDK